MTAMITSPHDDTDTAMDHAPVRLEPLAAGDVETVLQVFDGLGPRSREHRFLTPKPRLTGSDLRALSDVGDCDRVALVARQHGRAIGIARFVRDADDRAMADVAVAVVDDWQGRWVGTSLAQALVDRALELGITRFTMAIADDNEPALRLLHSVADHVTLVGSESGTVEFVASLGAPVLTASTGADLGGPS